MIEITSQMWQAALYGLVLALAGFLTIRSRKDEKPEYAEKRVETNGNGNGNGASYKLIAVTAESANARLERLEDDRRLILERFDRLDTELKLWRLNTLRDLADIINARVQPLDKRIAEIEDEKRKLTGDRK